MPRVTRGAKRRNRRKKILAQAKGFFQTKSKLYRSAKEAVDRSQKFAYVGRKLKKRDFRSLWIIRISAGSRQNGLSYSRLMHGLKVAGVEINRKMLAEMAVRDPEAFRQVAERAKNAMGEPPRAPAHPEIEPGGEAAASASPSEEQKPAEDNPTAKSGSASTPSSD